MKFSVAMCTYEGERFLPEQLASIAAQERPPNELVVCDDRSTDATRRIVESFAASAPFPVRLHVNERNLGSTENFGRAIGLCAGDVIALSDQDDVWRPDKLALMERCFSEDPSVGMVFSDAEVVDEQLRSLGRRLWSSSGFDEKKALIGRGRALDVMLPAYYVTGATMAFRSEFRDLVLPIPTDLPMIHDGWIALVIAAAARVAYIEEPLVMYRRHEGQQLGPPAGTGAGRGKQKNTPRHVLDAVRRPNSYADFIASLEAVRERLSRRGGADARLVSQVEDRLTHLKARSDLPAQAARRLLTVLRELALMRYHRYSRGIRSAAKDLLRPAALRRPARP